MHCGRDAAIGMDPIPAKQDIVCALAVDDEERGRDSVVSNGQIHTKDTLSF
jgi:hypothetical protein